MTTHTITLTILPYDILTMKSHHHALSEAHLRFHCPWATSAAAALIHPKDHLLNFDSSCDFQASIFWLRVGVLTLLLYVRARLQMPVSSCQWCLQHIQPSLCSEQSYWLQSAREKTISLYYFSRRNTSLFSVWQHLALALAVHHLFNHPIKSSASGKEEIKA